MSDDEAWCSETEESDCEWHWQSQCRESDASVCELGPDQQKNGFVLEIDREQQVCAKKLKKLAQTSLKASFITTYNTCQEFLTCVCGKALCNDLYGEAKLKMSTFFRL